MARILVGSVVTGIGTALAQLAPIISESAARRNSHHLLALVARHSYRWATPRPPDRPSMRRLLASSVLTLSLAAGVDAQGAPPVSLPGTQQHELSSAVNGQRYRLFVAPPEGYAAGDSARYPVLYVLDAHYSFPAAVAARASMGIFRELEGMFIVGIADGEYAFNSWFTNRWRDYTPSADRVADSSFAQQYKIPAVAVRSGGAADFLRVLRTEVIPFIDARYRTTSDRGIAGHSLGGLFAAYALFTAPDLFQRYGINSPSLWWKQSELFAAESTFAATHTALPARVFLSVGSQEGRSMVPPMERFAKTLGGRGYRGLVLDTVVFQGESHTSVVPAMMARTLRVLYPRRK